MKKENTSESESYKKINLETYYRKGIFQKAQNVRLALQAKLT